MQTINRRNFLKSTLALGVTASLMNISGVSAAKVEKPNFVFIFTDDQGWGDMGAFGHKILKTPNMDRLASQGCKMNEFYVTAPVCAPSRAGMMTGRIQNRFGMSHILNADSFKPMTLDYMCHVPLFHHVPAGEPMLSEQLQKAGYATGHIGKWHLSMLNHRDKGEPTPNDYGFDYWFTLEGGGKGHYKEPAGWIRNGQKVPGRHADWTNELYFNEAINFIEENKSKPFYLNIWSFTPHERHECPQSYKDMYSERTPQEQVYMGSLTHFDHELGRFLDYLEESGLCDNTVIIFASDNGPESAVVPWGPNSRGRTPFKGHKHVLHEGGIRVPGIVKWPGVTEPGSECNVAVSTLDIFPTLCSAAGAQLPDNPDLQLDGGDFRAAIKGEQVKRKQPLYWQCEFAPAHYIIGSGTSKALAMREGPWKIMSDMSFENFELYNLDFDPAEHWNLVRQHPDILEKMKVKLKKIFDEVNGPYSKNAKYINPNIPNRTVSDHADWD
jgi:arylsulfatase A